MKLYETNNMFRKADYIECLAKIGVNAYATDNGVMIDIDAYKANYKGWNVAHMVYINHQYVKQLY